MNKINKGTIMRYFKDQKGEVSLFVVIFATLLITIVTVAFVRIMIQGQQAATATDLSQSAYDSSLAGVEDAKRAIIEYQKQGSIDNIINSSLCNEAINTLINGKPAGDTSEIQVQASESGNKFNQAYTCVKVTMDTLDNPGSLKVNESNLVSLNSGSDKFDTVQVEWFTQGNLSGSLVSIIGDGSTPLFAQGNWPVNRPPILRTQMIQFTNGNFNLNGFDPDVSGKSDNAHTLFLYPVKTASGNIIPYDFNRDARQTTGGAPLVTSCRENLGSGGYACTARLTMSDPIGGTSASRTAFLRLTALYNKTDYKVTLLDTSGGPDKVVTFKGVKPIVDSTGRADNLFRRVRARVELNTGFSYPEAEVLTTGDFCKDFRITNNPDDFSNINNIGLDGLINGCKP